MPCGSNQWEEVASQLYNAGFESRDANTCKLKFDKLHTTPKPTGTAAIPCFVAMAKDIKEAISAEEVIGIFVLNDDNKDFIHSPIDVINGTHSFEEEQRMKRPVTKRTRSNDIANLHLILQRIFYRQFCSLILYLSHSKVFFSFQSLMP